MPAIEPTEARPRSPTSTPAHGRQQMAPIAAPVNVTCSPGSRRSSGFCATTPPA